MDIADFIPEKDTITVTLKHPASGEVLCNDDGTPMTVEVLATFSKEYRTLVHEQADKRIKEKKKDFTATELDEASLNLLVKATKSWNITFKKEQPKLTEKKAREIYDNVFWLRNQVEDAVNSHEAFTKA